MIRTPTPPSGSTSQGDRGADDQSLFAASLAATPDQRLVWLEEALCVAYACGVLKPRKLMGKKRVEGEGLFALLIVWAIAEGRKMAAGIDQYLQAGKSAKKSAS